MTTPITVAAHPDRPMPAPQPSNIITLKRLNVYALRLPYVAVELRDGVALDTVAATGQRPDHLLQLPLVFQGEDIGQLVCGQRGGSEAFSDADLRLLRDIARQTGIAAHGVQLTADLQRSRDRLVSTREEERRRLRRDLHDGLGATLAGIVLQLGAARMLISRNPDAAALLLEKLHT
ncbi:histidine kinase, partial [Mycobacterium sp.]|uniref:histidine kinase n=1 Tax=Mycobacterium sp. TaxID=1785 RepID=UPI002B75BBB4